VDEALLVLEDGFSLRGYSIGARGTFVGEVCFNTSMTGYQEILTDPSYRGQLVALTYPHIGNYGICFEDSESTQPQVAGLIIRSLTPRPSNWRSQQTLQNYLVEHSIGAISGVDTRALVLHIREKGTLRGVLTTEGLTPQQAANLARQFDYAHHDFVSEVTTPTPFVWDPEGTQSQTALHSSTVPPATLPIAFIDYGTKRNILRNLRRRGFLVHVFPASATASEILSCSPRGLFLSNGPGDPALLTHTQSVIRQLIGKIPIFGICLGHQILSLALGAKTYKLKFGHRGANHPVKNLLTGQIFITSQNHGYAVESSTLPKDTIVTHINLNDNTCAGIKNDSYRIAAVQFHPEACPGPHDAVGFFDEFYQQVLTG